MALGDGVKGRQVALKRNGVQVRASVDFAEGECDATGKFVAVYNFDPLAPVGSGNCPSGWEKWGGSSFACAPAPAP